MSAIVPAACMVGLLVLIIALLLAAATVGQADAYRQHERDGGDRG